MFVCVCVGGGGGVVGGDSVVLFYRHWASMAHSEM